jgi:hypothetical protein
MKVSRGLLQAVIVTGTVVTAGCDGFVGFIAVSPNGVVLVFIDPPVLTGQSYVGVGGVGSGCPAHPPALATFQLGIRSPSEDLSIRAVTLRFSDASGATGNPVSYSPSEMTQPSAPPLVPRGVSRNFAFSVPYGCSPPHPTVLSAHLTMVTRSGGTVESEAVASIR